MILRLTFLLVAAFWVTMNVLLWRAEYGSHDGEIPVPVDLVWRKIMTAPDASLLNIFQNGQRTGFCELSTDVGQAMAKLDEDRPPPEGVATDAGYQIHFGGNTSFGDFTNRVKFDGRIQFSSDREWRELNLKISSHFAVVEIHSVATNQTIHVVITSAGSLIERNLTFADLQNPNSLLRAFGGNFAVGLLGDFELPVLPQASSSFAQSFHWQAQRDRTKLGREPVSVYRLETRVLDRPIVIYVSTLGEILRVELPGNIIAALDEWNRS
jgi:hypothetical protein